MADARRAAIYDSIGAGYTAHRRADPRVAAAIHRALGGARSIIDVGAGTGSYEPDDALVVAVEPSAAMVRQRAPGAAPAVRGVAEHLPVRDGAFDAALVSLSLHHWPDLRAGLRELRRVAGRQVVFLFDPAVHERYWLIQEYLPGVARLPATHRAPLATVLDELGGGDVSVVPVPHDCVDGFMWAHWRRPHAYLDPKVRACMSGIALLDQNDVERAMARLAADLESGEWARRHADLLALDEIDGGFRLIVAGDR
jgi:SAM-dependent methyltransferase